MLDVLFGFALLLVGLTGIVISRRYKFHFEFHNSSLRVQLGIEPRDSSTLTLPSDTLEQAPETSLMNHGDTLN